ncbi:probable polysaccharide biosynthesis protein [Rivularia sp. IAM M-261]|nr:probable polysaccharide biosynthesis protein [Rivularia sp. IAM M-261]
MLRKVINNTIWLSLEQILRLGIGFFVGAWLARYLQPQQFGVLNYTIGFVGLFSPLAYLNDLNQIVIRDITLEHEDKNEIIGTSFILKLFGSLITVIFSTVAIILLRPNDNLAQSLTIILSFSTIFYSFNTIDCWFQQQIQSKYTVIAKNITFIFITLGRIFLISTHAPLIAFAWVIFVEGALNSIALVITYYIKGQALTKWQFCLKRTKKLIKDSWTLILSGLAISIYLRIDQTMLGQIIGDYEVGIYSVAVRFSELCCFLPSAFVSSVFSSIIQEKQKNDTEFYRRLQQLFDIMVLMAYGFAIIIILSSNILVNLVYGENYAATTNVVMVHIWSIIFMFLGFAKNIWVIAEKQGAYTLASTFIGAIMNIFLNLWLIPNYQAIGAAIATIISYAFADYISCLLYKPARPIFGMITKSLTLTSYIFKIWRK